MKPEFIYFKEFSDGRGGLVVLEQNHNVPFEIKRVYFIYGTPGNTRRGFHAHKALKQVAICVKGACSFLLDNGKEKINCRLDSPTIGLYIGNNTWREMYNFTEDCVLMVLASELYNEEDYIRDYGQFISTLTP